MLMRLKCTLIVFLKAVYLTVNGLYALIGVRTPYGSKTFSSAAFIGTHLCSLIAPTHRPYNSMRQPSRI